MPPVREPTYFPDHIFYFCKFEVVICLPIHRSMVIRIGGLCFTRQHVHNHQQQQQKEKKTLTDFQKQCTHKFANETTFFVSHINNTFTTSLTNKQKKNASNHECLQISSCFSLCYLFIEQRPWIRYIPFRYRRCKCHRKRLYFSCQGPYDW